MSWRAQYEQYGKWHDMTFSSINVELTPGGLIMGKGSDEVGQFTFQGSLHMKEPKCGIHKQYLGKHAIYYQGNVNAQAGEINGSWGWKPGDSNGGFRMKRM